MQKLVAYFTFYDPCEYCGQVELKGLQAHLLTGAHL